MFCRLGDQQGRCCWRRKISYIDLERKAGRRFITDLINRGNHIEIMLAVQKDSVRISRCCKQGWAADWPLGQINVPRCAAVDVVAGQIGFCVCAPIELNLIAG